MTISGPRQWCTPARAFGQLALDGEPVTVRVWNPPSGNDPVVLAKFRAAVMQNVICLYVRSHKNALAHPRGFADRGFPLDAFAALDERTPGDSEKWQGRLTGRYNMTTQDFVTIMEILPGAMPPEGAIKEFLDVAQKRIPRPSGWRWPDS